MIIKSIHLASNGNILALDESGNMIPALQDNVIFDWAGRAEKLGFDLAGAKILTDKTTFRISRIDGALRIDAES